MEKHAEVVLDVSRSDGGHAGLDRYALIRRCDNKERSGDSGYGTMVPGRVRGVVQWGSDLRGTLWVSCGCAGVADVWVAGGDGRKADRDGRVGRQVPAAAALFDGKGQGGMARKGGRSVSRDRLGKLSRVAWGTGLGTGV